MGFNFPDAPTIGQLHPTPAQVGVPQYQWNGTEWVVPEYNPLNYVLKSGDSMTGALLLHANASAALQAVPKQQLEAYAAPLDALSYSGMQINGSMEVSQEKGTAATTTSSYMIDGWTILFAGTMTVSSGQNVASANLFSRGFTKVLAAGPTTPQASMGANDYIAFSHPIEGYRIAKLGWGTANAKPITIAFWSEHHRPGVYSGIVRNVATTQSYGFTYTHNVADVAQYNVVTIPGSTSGVWPVDNTIGIQLFFAIAIGSTTTAPAANVWAAGNYVGVTGQVNGFAAVSDVFRITGVVVLPGTHAPTAAQSPLIMRPYGEELLTCQRYFEKSLVALQMGPVTAGQSIATWFFKVQKRATPTMTFAGGSAGAGTGYCLDWASIAQSAIGNYAVIGVGSTADARL